MKKTVLSALAFVAMTGAASANRYFECRDINTTLSFVLYEDSNGATHGQMYLNDVQVANMNAWTVNSISIRATVNGNGSNVELVFNSSREAVYVEVNGGSELVCNADVS
jgi:general stress protein 26